MKIVSWNVNGIRSIVKKGFKDFLDKNSPDILCIQETKSDKQELLLEGYEQYWNSAKKKGYSGTAVFTKITPKSVYFDIESHDNEGRVITLEFEKFYLVNVYVPNSKRGLTRLDYRKEWDRDFLKYLKKIEKNKPVVVCGDLNVAHKGIDLANPKANERNAGFTIEERKGLSKVLDSGFVDTFRMFNEKPEQYTWWTYRFNARNRNIGWRIDYFLVSSKLKKEVKRSEIFSKILGSDHAPILLEIDA